jgi:ATP-dependent DNA helicase RecQ
MLESSLPLHRVREFSTFINKLSDHKADNRKASELLAMVDALSSNNKGSPWWRMLEGFFRALVDETADAMLPVGWAVDSLYDYVAEQRREKFLGSGFFLGTIHSTKGMEFPHVVILDGDWGAPSGDKQAEEERRTLYVGMTRAKETLALMRSEERPNPLLRELRGDFLLVRKGAAPTDSVEDCGFKQYEVLGLSDVYLDYAGNYHQSDPIHAHLSRIQAGDKAFLTVDKPAIKICDKEGFCVGRLSKNASDKWREKLGQVKEVRVVAMVERDRMGQQETYRGRIKAEKWEVPVLEVVYA